MPNFKVLGWTVWLESMKQNVVVILTAIRTFLKIYKNWKKKCLDIHPKNLYAKIQVSRLNGMVRITHRIYKEYISKNV